MAEGHSLRHFRSQKDKFKKNIHSPNLKKKTQKIKICWFVDMALAQK